VVNLLVDLQLHPRPPKISLDTELEALFADLKKMFAFFFGCPDFGEVEPLY
jgi:hypothetical protein